MKKTMQWVLAATVMICGASVFTACSTNDLPVVPDQTYDAAEELATETFDHDDWIDRSVKPGDAFWHFALGGWLKTRDAEDCGTINNVAIMIKDRLNQNLNNYDSPVSGKLIKLLTQAAPEKSEEIKAITDFLATLKLDGEVSKANLIRNFGKLTDVGCPALVTPILTCMNGQVKCVLCSGLPYNYLNILVKLSSLQGVQNDTPESGEIDDNIRFVLGDLMGLDLDDPDIKAKAKDIEKIEKKCNDVFNSKTGTDSQSGMIMLKRIQPATLHSLVASRHRAGEAEDPKTAFNEAFHVEESTYIDDSVDLILAMLDEFSTDTWLLYQQYYVYGRLSTMLRCTNKYDEMFNVLQRIKCLVPSATLDYEFATLLGDCDTQGCVEILEDMRRRMSERIEQLDWLSSATKAKAQEKLQAMVFTVGRPEHLYSDDFELTGSTAVEAGMQFMRQFVARQRSYDGLPAYDHILEVLSCNLISQYSATSVNAFYVSQANQLIINPAFTMPQIFPTDKYNAQHYAVSMVFGHEMTHAFDPTGAKYDAHGLEKNWWTDGDMAQFKLLQQQIIDRYHELEVLPGVMADGVKTLNENVADLGGVSLAYDLWTEKLKANGLTGEALRHQQRQFFLSYAVVWNLYRTDEELLDQIKTDEHSACHNRINGISRLIDDWYDLFGVKPGDKLYLAPADRVKIW
jgi:hypothetical protein